MNFVTTPDSGWCDSQALYTIDPSLRRCIQLEGEPMNNRRTRWPLLVGAATFLGATFAAVPSFAQDRIIEEILVTARKREEVLTDVPASITVLSGAQLERAGVERVADFIKLVPGMSLVDAAEVGDTQVNIRGINGARDAENSFAFILDGILMTNPAAFNREYINLQQIEVLKGPQGALYGRNAAAGAVIVTTQKPDDTMRFKFKGSAGEDSTYTGVISAMGPLVEGSSYFSVSADWRDTDGFHSNSFTGDDSVDDFESWNINGRLLFEPSDNLTLDFKARYGEVDAASITFNASFALPVVAEIFGDPNFYEDSNDHDFEFQANIDPQNDQDSLELSGKLDYDADWGTVTAWALYSNIENSLSADGTSGAFGFFIPEPTCRQTTADEFAAGTTLPSPQILAPVPEFSVFGPYTPVSCDGTQYQERNQEDYSFEVRVASPDDQQLRWLGGLYYLHIDREVGVNLGIDLGFGVTESLFVPQNGLNPTEQLLWDDFETDVYAVFGQLEYDISDTVEIAVALRYDREERDASSKVPVNAT
ncbi:MAG: TonB-dependent receptor, partial [Gammaproteobacteria bacterium]